MAPLSSAERCKRWLEKNKAKVLAKDVLRKRYRRVQMKHLDPPKNEARLLKERLYKREYRKKMKELVSQSTETLTSESESTTEGFSQRSSKLRSIKKGEKALPKSPRKRNAMMTSLAKKFQLRIVPQSENRGRPKLELNKEEKSWLTDFLGRQDITYVTPGKRNQVYIGKMAGEKTCKTKQYLLWTLNEASDIANGCSATEVKSKEDSFVNQFGRNI